MAELSQTRAARTTAKRAVTNAARRLEQAVELQLSTTPELVRTLETKFNNFNDLCDEFNSLAIDSRLSEDDRVVNGLSPEDYEAETLETFKRAIQAYKKSISTCVPAETLAPSAIHLKRREIPSFSGERKDWPEFKRMWQELVVPAVGNKVALASDLKAACKSGKAFTEIKNISAGAINAYDTMWQALCLHYDNIVLAATSALSEIKTMTTVKDNDYCGTVELIRKIESVYNQLNILSQVD